MARNSLHCQERLYGWHKVIVSIYCGWNSAVFLERWLANSGMETMDHVQMPCVLQCPLGAFAGLVVRLP